MNNELSLSNATIGQQTSNTQQALGLQSLLYSGQPLPGYLSSLPGGVSNAQSQNEAQMGLQGLSTQFQQMGGLDSGSYAQAGANAYANTMNQNAQFNISNLGNLMNLAAGGSYNTTGALSSNASALGQQSGALAGTSSSSTVFANPFQEMLGLGQSAIGAAGAASTGGTIASGFGF